MNSKLKFLYKINQNTLKKYEENDNSVFFTKPTLVAFYDYNNGHLSESKSIKYFRIPKSNEYPIDLNEGFHTYKDRSRNDFFCNINASLRYEMSSDAERYSAKMIDRIKVITRCGTLNEIMEKYYNAGFGKLKIRVSRYNGVFYMVKEDDNESEFELKPIHSHHSQLKKNVFTDSPNSPPNINKPCDENIQQIGVFRSNFGKYDMIYSTQIEGIISNEEIKDFTDLEALNNCRLVISKQMWKRLKTSDAKYISYWLQSYLTNVKDIYFGFKDPNGIIHEPLEHKFSRDLPKERFWKPSICTGLLYEFLENVEKVMSSVNCLNTVYLFHYKREEKSYYYEVFKGKTEKSFINQEYINYCKNL